MNKTIAFYARSLGILLCMLLPSLAFADDKEAYVELMYNAMYFRYDDQRKTESQTYTTYDLPTATNPTPGWKTDGRYANITDVIFLDEFKDVRPTTCESWFEGMTKLIRLREFENLNTSEVTSMKNMFKGVTSRESFDIAIVHFETYKVTTMEGMFEGCTALTSVDLTKFNTENVTNMSNMFSGCSKLTTIAVTNNFSTKKVTSSTDMFAGCSSIRNYSASSVDASKAIDFSLNGYLTNNEVLPTAWAGFNKSDGVLVFHYNKYRYCSKDEATYDLPLDGSKTAWYDPDNIKGPENIKSILISNEFKDVRPTSCAYWFRSIPNMVQIDSLENLNTSQVTSMEGLFYGCISLRGLDLSTFDTHNVTTMVSMFEGAMICLRSMFPLSTRRW